MPFALGGDPLFNHNDSQGQALPHHEMAPPSNPSENPQAPEPKKPSGFSGRDFMHGDPLSGHHVKEESVDGVFHDKHGREVDHLSKYDMRKNIAHDIVEEEAKLRRKLGLEEKSGVVKFGKKITDSFSGHPDQFSEWKIEKELGEAKRKLERDRGLGEARFKEESKSEVIGKDKQRIKILDWLRGK